MNIIILYYTFNITIAPNTNYCTSETSFIIHMVKKKRKDKLFLCINLKMFQKTVYRLSHCLKAVQPCFSLRKKLFTLSILHKFMTNENVMI